MMATGKLGKFQERIKKIRLYKTNKKIKISKQSIEKTKEYSINVGKIVIGVPLIISGGIKNVIDSMYVEKKQKKFAKEEENEVLISPNYEEKIDLILEKLQNQKVKLITINSMIDIEKMEIYILNLESGEKTKEDSKISDRIEDNLNLIDNLSEYYKDSKKNFAKEDNHVYLLHERENIKNAEEQVLKIDEEILKLEYENQKLELEKKEKLDILGLNEKDLIKLEEKFISLEKTNLTFEQIIANQDKFLTQLEDRINVIDVEKKMEYSVRGLGELINNLVKYFGLICLFPFSNLIPGIAINTLATKKMLNVLINNINFNEKEKIIYSAYDYSKSISNEIYDLNATSSLINDTLVNIKKLKSELKEDFKNHPLYDEMNSKLNRLEHSVLINQCKINILKDKLEENNKINKDKLIKVKSLSQ